MPSDAWGVSSAPAIAPADVAPLPLELARLAALAESATVRLTAWSWPTASDLPEVQDLEAQGWYPQPASPVAALLPAVWPTEHRCWVADRRPRVTVVEDDDTFVVRPLGRAQLDAAQGVATLEAARHGFGPPPLGRLWLLRTPYPSIGTRTLLRLFDQRVHEQSVPVTAGTVADAAREVLAWDEERIWAWWPGPDAEIARQWRALGRAGDEVAEAIEEHVEPGGPPLD